MMQGNVCNMLKYYNSKSSTAGRRVTRCISALAPTTSSDLSSRDSGKRRLRSIVQNSMMSESTLTSSAMPSCRSKSALTSSQSFHALSPRCTSTHSLLGILSPLSLTPTCSPSIGTDCQNNISQQRMYQTQNSDTTSNISEGVAYVGMITCASSGAGGEVALMLGHMQINGDEDYLDEDDGT